MKLTDEKCTEEPSKDLRYYLHNLSCGLREYYIRVVKFEDYIMKKLNMYIETIGVPYFAEFKGCYFEIPDDPSWASKLKIYTQK